jgi:hypothetical protein
MLDKKVKNIEEFALGEGVEYPEGFCIFSYLYELSLLQESEPEPPPDQHVIDPNDYEDDPRLPRMYEDPPEEVTQNDVEDDYIDDPCLPEDELHPSRYPKKALNKKKPDHGA